MRHGRYPRRFDVSVSSRVEVRAGALFKAIGSVDDLDGGGRFEFVAFENVAPHNRLNRARGFHRYCSIRPVTDGAVGPALELAPRAMRNAIWRAVGRLAPAMGRLAPATDLARPRRSPRGLNADPLSPAGDLGGELDA